MLWNTWEELMELGTVDDLYVEVKDSIKAGHPVPVDVLTKLGEHGIYI